MLALIRTLTRVVWRLLSGGVPLTDSERQALAPRLLPIVQRHRRRAYAASVQRINEQMPGITPAAIRPYDAAAIEAVLATVGGRDTPPVKVPVEDLDPRSRRTSRVRVEIREQTRTDPAVTRVVAARAGARLARHARQAGRDAVIDTANGAGDEIGWARVLSGSENCAFCAMLASRGPVYRSDKSASRVVGRNGQPRGSRDLGEQFHDHCDCDVVLVRRGRDWEGREQYEQLERLWIAADTVAEGEPTRKVFRRAYARHKDLAPQLERIWRDSAVGLSGDDARRAFAAAVRNNPPAALVAALRPRRAQ
ncbi:hypothetical protein [Nocardia transvalensis]|uniref:VG15 protein n=1 Tax=Nocardia transvalensis TaxID=37333 RepID=UPI001893572A|nr:hypothetical protein [Nocardia transvalensis]MBF6328741.1 hypothetical protein [Nocardia transvalensis]